MDKEVVAAVMAGRDRPGVCHLMRFIVFAVNREIALCCASCPSADHGTPMLCPRAQAPTRRRKAIHRMGRAGFIRHPNDNPPGIADQCFFGKCERGAGPAQAPGIGCPEMGSYCNGGGSGGTSGAGGGASSVVGTGGDGSLES